MILINTHRTIIEHGELVRICIIMHKNENRFLAFGSLISNAEVENAMISDCITVCSKFSEIQLLRFFFCSVYVLRKRKKNIKFQFLKLKEYLFIAWASFRNGQTSSLSRRRTLYVLVLKFSSYDLYLSLCLYVVLNIK